jgi:RND family efflux transporter MFP subunit
MTKAFTGSTRKCALARLFFLASLPMALVYATGAGAQEFSKQSFDCVMDPEKTVRIGSPVSGLLQVVEVERGDQVKRGQVIARITSKVEAETVALLATRAASDTVVAAQQARYNLFKKRYQRTKDLLARKVVPRERLEEVETDLTASLSELSRAQLDRAIARKELSRAKADLDLRVIRSPIDGIVVERRLNGGEYVSETGYIVSLVRLNPLRVEAFLPVRYFKSVKLGATATVRPAAPVAGKFNATVVVVDKVFDVASGTFGIRLNLPNKDGTLPAGHRCQLTFNAPKSG